YEGLPGAGIFIGGPYNTVSNNELVQNKWGISLIRSLIPGEDRSNNVIEWNSIDASSLGIHLHGSGTYIANNSIVSGDSGLSVFMDSRDNVIVDNLIEGNQRGVHLEGLRNFFGRNSVVSSDGFGLMMEVATSCIVQNNTIASNGGVGIGFGMASKYNTISWNEVASNRDGIRLYGLHGGTASSFENTFHHNVIRDNSYVQAEDKEPFTNFWNSSCSGNYWSDYSGVDVNGDGIGDSPYVIDNGGVDDAPSIDYLPLMSPDIDPCNSPGILEASMSGPDLEDITVTWKKSRGEGQPQGVIKYRVMRANHIVGPYIVLSEIPASGSSEYAYTDFGMGHGQPDGLFYYVQAIDGSGRVGISGLAAKYVRDLQAGMQLISTPLSLFDNRAQSVLQTISYNDVWVFDVGDPNDPWKSYSESKPYDGPIAFEIGTGVWVNVEEAGTWTIVGMYPLSRSIPLRSGWNLVGYPSLVRMTVAKALAGTPYVTIEAY
ncbi:MAG: right-handed parallel beta-helix repeat-containing protein, partial [Thermoplasmata archaeon]|nr:right-handed parallel beta-helix repeat-containing protein [Thermoplasmata archaeon]